LNANSVAWCDKSCRTVIRDFPLGANSGQYTTTRSS
jgi:hypothetical protein